MATTEHASNEQMATILGWVIEFDEWVKDNKYATGYTNIPGRYDYFDPTENLNHAALVEARLAELGVQEEYMQQLLKLVNFADVWSIATASAQTRCDAAWTTWQQYQEQGN